MKTIIQQSSWIIGFYFLLLQTHFGINDGSSSSERGIQNRLLVTTILQEPYMMLRKDISMLQGNDRFEGYLADLLELLSEQLRFTYELRLVKDGTYGVPDMNESWTGMIGELIKGEAHIAAAPLAVTQQRSKVVHFTTPFMTVQSTALIRKRRRNRFRKLPKIKLVGDLLNQRDIHYGSMEGSLSQFYLRASRIPIYRRMWSNMANTWPTVFVQNIQEGVERVRRDDYAFILDSAMAEYLSGQRPCEFYTIEPFLEKQHYALALQRGNRFIERLDDIIESMRTTNVLEKLYSKWWKSECVNGTAGRRRSKNVKEELTVSKDTDSKLRSDVASPIRSTSAGLYFFSVPMLTIFSLFLTNTFHEYSFRTDP